MNKLLNSWWFGWLVLSVIVAILFVIERDHSLTQEAGWKEDHRKTVAELCKTRWLIKCDDDFTGIVTCLTSDGRYQKPAAIYDAKIIGTKQWVKLPVNRCIVTKLQ